MNKRQSTRSCCSNEDSTFRGKEKRILKEDIDKKC